MDTILTQLKILILQAVPTVLLVVLFYFFLKFNFFRPLEKVLTEREARTEGARRSAEQAQADAKEKSHAYEAALRSARVTIYAEQEAARRSALRERDTRIREARNQAMEEVRAARERLDEEMEQAREEVAKESVRLGAELGRALLERTPHDGTPWGITR
ncbi:MAG: ATP synthase F0 subunit B [Acidobacteria bacterium]|nr:ATP synthase F0 subunit B [Acidobacteriota bacterium]